MHVKINRTYRMENYIYENYIILNFRNENIFIHIIYEWLRTILTDILVENELVFSAYSKARIQRRGIRLYQRYY